jgi:hypothetical protein
LGVKGESKGEIRDHKRVYKKRPEASYIYLLPDREAFHLLCCANAQVRAKNDMLRRRWRLAREKYAKDAGIQESSVWRGGECVKAGFGVEVSAQNIKLRKRNWEG